MRPMSELVRREEREAGQEQAAQAPAAFRSPTIAAGARDAASLPVATLAAMPKPEHTAPNI